MWARTMAVKASFEAVVTYSRRAWASCMVIAYMLTAGGGLDIYFWRGSVGRRFRWPQRDDDRFARRLVGAGGDVAQGDERVAFGVVHGGAAFGDVVGDGFEVFDGAGLSLVV